MKLVRVVLLVKAAYGLNNPIVSSSKVARQATATDDRTPVDLSQGPVVLSEPLPSYTFEDRASREQWDEMFIVKGREKTKTDEEDDDSIQRVPVIPKEEEEDKKSMVKELTSFTLPLLLVWLSSPLLSLADSAFIGAFRSTAELAALGPACSMSDNTFFAATFVSVVTTSSVAAAIASDDERGARAATAAGCVAALGVGLVLTAFLYGASPAILASCGKDLAPSAVNYVQYRCIGFAPALISASLQAASMARRDVRAPVIAALVAGGINLIVDALLVPKYGLIGAAQATAFAQYASLIVMLNRAYSWRKHKQSVIDYETDNLRQPPKKRPLLRGWQDRLSPRFPRTCIALKNCVVTGTPILASLLAKCAVCAGLVVAATRSAVGRGALPDAAAHQILTALYWLFAPVGDALSSTVQTFAPAARAKDAREQRDPTIEMTEYGSATKAVVAGATKAALALGFINALMAIALPTLAPILFTRDLEVTGILLATVPLLGLNLLLHAAAGALEGTMLAFKDTRRLSILYAFDAAAILAVFSALAATHAPLSHVWLAFFGYQTARALQFALRVRETVFSSSSTKKRPGFFLKRILSNFISAIDKKKKATNRHKPVIATTTLASS